MRDWFSNIKPIVGGRESQVTDVTGVTERRKRSTLPFSGSRRVTPRPKQRVTSVIPITPVTLTAPDREATSVTEKAKRSGGFGRALTPVTPVTPISTNIPSGNHHWSASDWQAYFDERAGIAEFDGGLTRQEAEAVAFECCVTEWLNRNRVESSPDICAGCGGGEGDKSRLIPFGTSESGYSWLHLKCSPDWHVGRRATAAGVLAVMGIVVSTEPSGDLGMYVK